MDVKPCAQALFADIRARMRAKCCTCIILTPDSPDKTPSLDKLHAPSVEVVEMVADLLRSCKPRMEMHIEGNGLMK